MNPNHVRTIRVVALALLAFSWAPGGHASTRRASAFAQQEVKAAVETWVRRVTADARPDAQIERMEAHVVAGDTVAFIVHLAGGGFCLAGNDPTVLPVYLYSPRGRFDASHPMHRYVLGEIARRRAEGRKAVASGTATLSAQLDERGDYWSRLIRGETPATRVSVNAGPVSLVLPLTSKWDQIGPWNGALPKPDGARDERVLVGCAATAAAQIMKYWKWPQQGVGSRAVPYTYRYRPTWISEPLASAPTIPPGWNPNESGTFGGRLQWTAGQLQMKGAWDATIFEEAWKLDPNYPSPTSNYTVALLKLWDRMYEYPDVESADFGIANYNWDLVQDTYPANGEADNELAEINRHVAIACGMKLGIWSSETNLEGQLAAFENHFRFDTDAGLSMITYQLLVDEIQWGRPVSMYGRDSDSGHLWVIYGYNTATDPYRQFMMNYGWSGQSDGWYTLDSMLFTENCASVANLAPVNVKFVGGSEAGDGSPANPFLDLAEAKVEAANGTTLRLRAGSSNLFHGTLDRPMTIQAIDATIR